MLSDLERYILFWIEKIVYHFVVDLQIAHCDKAFRGVRCQSLYERNVREGSFILVRESDGFSALVCLFSSHGPPLRSASWALR